MTRAPRSATGPVNAGRSVDLGSVLSALIAAELPAAVELRHALHRNAELSGAEAGTAATVAAALGASDAGPVPDAGAVHGGAVVADAGVVAGTGRLIRIGPAGGPAIAIRAELDALPIAEETGAPWSSATGAMHACGHDVHLAALTAVGRAAAAAAQRGDLPVAMLAVLQPREESAPSGAEDIAADAAFVAQQPAAMIGVHLQHQLPAGTVAPPPEPSTPRPTTSSSPSPERAGTRAIRSSLRIQSSPSASPWQRSST